MKFFIDTANLQELRECASWGSFSGVTINPVLMVKESVDYESHARAALKIIPKDWDISLEVRSSTAASMVKQAKIISAWDKRIRVKIPTTVEGVKAASIVCKNMKINMTVIKSATQALLCQGLAIRLDAMDMVVSIFCGRLRQVGQNWHHIIEALAKVKWNGKILAASMKTPTDISEAISAGADIITAPQDVYKMAFTSSLVEEDVNAFNDAFDLKGLEVPGSKGSAAAKVPQGFTKSKQ